MSDSTLPLFDGPLGSSPPLTPEAASSPVGKARVSEPMRSQGEIRFEVPEDMLPPSHVARVLWNVLGTLELSAFSRDCGSVEGGAGRSLKSPRMLLTLWLYAISQGVGSAREIARLVTTDVAYRWVVGNVQVG